jgi:hypothetical protein
MSTKDELAGAPAPAQLTATHPSEKHDTAGKHDAPEMHDERAAMAIARAGGWEVDALLQELEDARVAEGARRGPLDLEFRDPRHFTWLLVAFASMGGLLSGLDQVRRSCLSRARRC